MSQEITTSPSPTPAAPRRPRFLLPFWAWVVLLGVGGIVLFQKLELFPDPGQANLASLSLGALSVLLLVGWFGLFSGFSRVERVIGVGAFFVALAIAVVALRFEGWTGAMGMRFALRFAPRKSDQLHSIAPQSRKVDLVTTTPFDFPQFLGPERDGNVPNIAIDADWSAHPPKLVWRQPIGAGWAGIAIANGFALTLEQRGAEEWVSCYDVKTGGLQWASALKERHEHIPGGVGPRSTPTIHKGKVYALGATGKLRCLDGATGSIVWQKDLLKEFGITAEEERADVHWGRSASPLILGDKVIVPAGGKTRRASLVAYHVDTGDELWHGGEHNVSYSSPTRARIDGVDQVLAVFEGYAAGHDVATGKQLWQFEWPGSTSGDANVSDLIQVGPDEVFLSKGYGVGAALMKIAHRGDSWDATPLWKSQRILRTKFSNVVLKDGYVYGLSDGRLECAELATGKKKWKDGSYGYGQNLRIGDHLVILSEEGEVVLVELSPDRPNNVLGKFQAIEGTTWNNFAISGPYLVVRNAQEAACYELPLAK